MKITMSEALRLYRNGLERGLDYAPSTDAPGPDRLADTLDGAVAAASHDGWEIVLESEGSDDVVVLRNSDGQLMAIGCERPGAMPRAVLIRGAQ